MTKAPRLALTFDDQYIDEWLSAADIFKAHDVRATFFIMGFPNIPSLRVMKLHKLLDLGHEIGFHSVNHLSAVEFSKEHGVDAYIQAEILPGVEAMKLMGFSPTSFAFPKNAHNEELDRVLSMHFRTLRARAMTLAEALQWDTKNPIIKARNCDTVTSTGETIRSVDDIIAELRHAAHSGASIALYGHGISDHPVDRHHMTLRGLDYMLWSAKRLGFEFVTANEFADAT
jgi:peptidoglycan/xylan/chitin deacetylase (PgdA/CDA1 family)